MYVGIYVLLAVAIVTSAIVAMFAKSLVHAIIALGVSSALLATLFFILKAPYAGGFELSVGTGLISVLLIIGLTLTHSLQEHPDAY